MYYARLSTGGSSPVNLELDFSRDTQSANYNRRGIANNLALTVRGVDAGSQVAATWSDHWSGQTQPVVNQVQLQWDGSKFVGSLPSTEISNAFASTPSIEDYDQTLRVTVDGKPLVDPISGEPQFQVSLARAFEAQSGQSSAAP